MITYLFYTGLTALHVAAQCHNRKLKSGGQLDSVRVIQALIQRGANLNIPVSIELLSGTLESIWIQEFGVQFTSNKINREIFQEVLILSHM